MAEVDFVNTGADHVAALFLSGGEAEGGEGERAGVDDELFDDGESFAAAGFANGQTDEAGVII